MSRGFVYILMSSATPDLVKIGQTTRSPDERARELSGETGVPMPYVVAYQEQLFYFEQAEREIHRRLQQFRVNQKREFFRIPLREAILVVADVTRQYHELEQAQIARAQAERMRLEIEAAREAEAEAEEAERMRLEVEAAQTAWLRGGSEPRYAEADPAPDAGYAAEQDSLAVDEDSDPVADAYSSSDDEADSHESWKSPQVFVTIFFCVAAAAILLFCLIAGIASIAR